MTPEPTRNPDPSALTGPAAALSFFTGVAVALATATSPFPRPGATADQVQTYFQGSAAAARVSVAGQLVSAAALLPFSASVARLAGRSGPGARTLQTAARAGGALAAAALATSALTSAALTGRCGEQDYRAAALHRRAFLAGGPARGAGFGLLVGALGLSGLRTGELSSPLAGAALALAAAGLLSPLYLVAEPAAWLIPAGRFSGLLVSAIGGIQMARSPG